MGHKDDIIAKLKKQIVQLEKERGSDDRSALLLKGDEFGRYQDWVPLEELVPQIQQVIAMMKSGDWSWAYNWNSKYVDIRIDMRDGHAIFTNKTGRVSLDQIKYQWKPGDE